MAPTVNRGISFSLRCQVSCLLSIFTNRCLLLTGSISPSVMIPENRLAILLDQVKASWINDCLYHNTKESPSLYHNHVCDRADFPNRSIHELRDHENEVWHLAFSNDGTRLATASQDKTVVIYDVTNNFRFLLALGDHDAGVCYVAWSPDDSKLLTCTREQDNSLRVWDTKVRVNPWRCCAATNVTSRDIVLANLLIMTHQPQLQPGHRTGNPSW